MLANCAIYPIVLSCADCAPIHA